MKTEIQDSSSSYFILLQLAVLDLIELLECCQKKSVRKWNKKSHFQGMAVTMG